jgi:hypothetical protein
MASRKPREYTLDKTWREKIKVSNIVTRLNKCAQGEVEMTAQQIKAAEILLKKVLPDLKGIDMTAKVDGQVRLEITTLDEKI